MLLSADGCCWLLLAAAGCCWLLLAVTGCWMLVAAGCWLLSAAAGCCWLLLAVAGCCWLPLAFALCCWLLLAAAGCCVLLAALSGCSGCFWLLAALLAAGRWLLAACRCWPGPPWWALTLELSKPKQVDASHHKQQQAEQTHASFGEAMQNSAMPSEAKASLHNTNRSVACSFRRCKTTAFSPML